MSIGHLNQNTANSAIVNPKDRIAQMILERISVPRLQQVEVRLPLA
jgi:dUTPase